MAIRADAQVRLGNTLTMLDGIRNRSRRLRPFLVGDMANAVHQFFADQFDTAGRTGGQPWAPLSPATLRYKALFGRANMGPLRFTNTLWASLTKRGHPLGRRLVTDTSLELGTNDPKAAKHQDGRPGLPARAIVPDTIPDGIGEQWDSLVLDYVEGTDDDAA